ncbi:hypothetical protein DAQ1742_01252 [Dickeya aquatica]|uniref:Uncharacterized protein n=1 Tax=Dickeya aquatica TaxID=1401087 RepID=A0A375A8E0_9GAMM|nr:MULTISPECIES: hypothetical protein [Dickeya]SLM62257.1 hypothetical protein DAQ1742_01252 [Dickeya aquatica]
MHSDPYLLCHAGSQREKTGWRIAPASLSSIRLSCVPDDVLLLSRQACCLPKMMRKYRQDYSSISKKVPTHKNRINETPMNKYFTDFSPALSRQQ